MQNAATEKQIPDHPTESIPVNSGVVTNNGFIVSKLYDWIWFVGAPTIGLVVAAILLFSGVADIEIDLGNDVPYSLFELIMGTFLTSHLFIVFFRSHANANIFAKHPVRFIAVPILLMLYLNFSINGLLVIAIIAIFWDVHHSAAQTFGLGRIYDMRMGNGQQVGRRLDYLLNLFIWVGPILAGASLTSHVHTFTDTIQPSGLVDFSIAGKIFNHRSELTKLVFVIGIPFILYYLYEYWRLHKQGYVVSINKVILLTTTAIISIFSWGFNSFGEAYFVMNFFHSWQYFAIVWAFEKKNITKVLLLSKLRNGRYVSLFLFVFIALGYGLWATISEDSGGKFSHSLMFTVTILHFWYDGFIWSVKRKQV